MWSRSHYANSSTDGRKRRRKSITAILCSKKGVSFITPFLISGISKTMTWQLLKNLLFLCTLTSRLINQPKTILIRRQINSTYKKDHLPKVKL